MKKHKYLKGLFTGNLYYLKETNSVLDDAFFLCQQKEKTKNQLFGTAILCDFQKQGRGQREKQWIAAPYSSLLVAFIFEKNLLLKLNNEITLPSQVVLCTAMAISKTILELFVQKKRDTHGMLSQELLNAETTIKWPNDILINNKKVAGILTETHGDWIVVGLGMNLQYQILREQFIMSKNSSCVFPTALDQFGIVMNAEQFYIKLQTHYEQAMCNSLETIISWTNKNLWMKNKKVSYSDNRGGNFNFGIVNYINSDGSLCLTMKHDKNYSVYSGQIRETK